MSSSNYFAGKCPSSSSNNSSSDECELSYKAGQLQFEDSASSSFTFKNLNSKSIEQAPLIVFEDVNEDSQTVNSEEVNEIFKKKAMIETMNQDSKSSLDRSASSLSVPSIELNEKRPPLPTENNTMYICLDDQMIIRPSFT